jgi:hypothetical protein
MLSRTFRNASLIANKSSPLTRGAAKEEKVRVITGSTKFTKKKKQKTVSLAAESKNRQSILKQFEILGKALRPTIVKPKRTKEELADAKARTMAWRLERIRADKHMKQAELLRVKMRRLAVEELPEKLRKNADRVRFLVRFRFAHAVADIVAASFVAT